MKNTFDQLIINHQVKHYSVLLLPNWYVAIKLPYICVIFILSLFGLVVKFSHMVWSNGYNNSVIRFLFIRSSGFGLMTRLLKNCKQDFVD